MALCIPSPFVTKLCGKLYILIVRIKVNLLAPELLLILTHPVYKLWIIQESNKLAVLNKLHFEEEKKTRTALPVPVKVTNWRDNVSTMYDKRR